MHPGVAEPCRRTIHARQIGPESPPGAAVGGGEIGGDALLVAARLQTAQTLDDRGGNGAASFAATRNRIDVTAMTSWLATARSISAGQSISGRTP